MDILNKFGASLLHLLFCKLNNPSSFRHFLYISVCELLVNHPWHFPGLPHNGPHCSLWEMPKNGHGTFPKASAELSRVGDYFASLVCSTPVYTRWYGIFFPYNTRHTESRIKSKSTIITASSSAELLHNNPSLSWGLADNQIQYFALDLYLISDLSVQNKLILIPSFNVYKAIPISVWQWLHSE